MNDEIEYLPVTRHRAMETGCCHWAPIVLPGSAAKPLGERVMPAPESTEAPAQASWTACD